MVSRANPKKRRGAASIRSKTKVKLSPEQRAEAKLKNAHKRLVRSTFDRTGFLRIAGISDTEFNFEGQTTDIDDFFVHENVFVLVEYTCTRSSSAIGDHLRKKKVPFDKILAEKNKFIDFCVRDFPASAEAAEEIKTALTKYHKSQIVLRILYCSRFDFDASHKANVPGPIYYDYGIACYFAAVSDAIRKSARFEFMHFLGIDHSDVGVAGTTQTGRPIKYYEGSILPEAFSNFNDGYKVVSFYADPGALLSTSYVLRKDGWQDRENLYQRMISKKKIQSIRDYLKSQERVFINNIIVTLPEDVKPIDQNGDTIDAKKLTKTLPIRIQLPDRPNSVGIIDGQHRVFAYHETHNDDVKIAKFRHQQNLLVTGIIYPPKTPNDKKVKFEAELFLEINSTQTSARPDLKQAIVQSLAPFSPDSIASRVLSGISRDGPLSGFIQQNFYDTDKLKRASIVSFGMKPLTKMAGQDSLFAIWKHSGKNAVLAGKDAVALAEYIQFAVSQINIFLSALKHNIARDRWTADKKVKDHVISTTYINSFLIVLRKIIETNDELNRSDLIKRFGGINGFNFTAYKSSQYARMADDILKAHPP